MRRTGTITGEGIRLLGPDLAALPAVLPHEALDHEQRRAAEILLDGGDVLVHGGPGSGRTALALAAAEASGEGTLLLAPRRHAAGRLRDALAVHGQGLVRAMTPPALGHAVLRADSLRRGRGEPTLVTGAEQDALLAELISLRESWHLDVDPGARTLPGFRTELRDLITRAGELGLTPAALEDLGRERGRPAWQDAAALLRRPSARSWSMTPRTSPPPASSWSRPWPPPERACSCAPAPTPPWTPFAAPSPTPPTGCGSCCRARSARSCSRGRTPRARA
ncbi:hypothetical protein [Brachybacterium massiliense]|uniref:hypothetical protein n=1 Tax=Brachybacterium massiliense TaxID=1755098 RepID=UPI001FEA623F|nr:hypothetical protein [Brachybacterium massiliense]